MIKTLKFEILPAAALPPLIRRSQSRNTEARYIKITFGLTRPSLPGTPPPSSACPLAIVRMSPLFYSTGILWGRVCWGAEWEGKNICREIGVVIYYCLFSSSSAEVNGLK